jgi:hypothetical protein
MTDGHDGNYYVVEALVLQALSITLLLPVWWFCVDNKSSLYGDFKPLYSPPL